MKVYLNQLSTVLIALSGLLLLNACGKPEPRTGSPGSELAAIRQTVRDRFPEVTQISPAQLAAWLTAGGRESPLLLDARNNDEYVVSHLRHAQLATTEAEALSVLKQAAKDQRIVVYCSVGWRSSALAQKLKARGYTNVANLEGSIFQWANEGRPVYRGDEQVTQVHPFDAQWGRLLKGELRFPLPESARQP